SGTASSTLRSSSSSSTSWFAGFASSIASSFLAVGPGAAVWPKIQCSRNGRLEISRPRPEDNRVSLGSPGASSAPITMGPQAAPSSSHRSAVSAQHPILSRLETGRPLLASADAEASLRARGVTLKWPAALGRLIREHPGVVADHYHQEVASG